MPPTLYLMRHGLTDANRDEIVAGTFESNLLPEGIEQARQAGVFLKDKDIKRIFCSPQGRTRKTLAAILETSQLPKSVAEFDPRLVEVNYGIYEAKPDASIPPEFRFRALLKTPSIKIPGGESLDEVCQRLRLFIDEKLVPCKDTCLIISHGGTCKRFLWEFLPGQREKVFIQRTGNAQIFKIENNDYESAFQPQTKTGT